MATASDHQESDVPLRPIGDREETVCCSVTVRRVVCERVSGEEVSLSLPINESTPREKLSVLYGFHDAGRPEKTRNWHRDMGSLLGKGRSDRQMDETDRD